MRHPLRYRNADNGNCRVYYTWDRRLWCWQLEDARNGRFALYVCSPDGEPSHEVYAGQFVTQPPTGGEAIERELCAFLDGQAEPEKPDLSALQAQAEAEVERLKAAGWDRDDFARALVKLLSGPETYKPEETVNARLLDALKIATVQLGEYRDGDGAAKFHALSIAKAAIAEAEAGDTETPLRAIIREALGAWREEFDGTAADLDVSGADLVDWFADWRQRAEVALGEAKPEPVHIRITVEGGLVQCVETLTGDPEPIIAEVWDFDTDGMDADEADALPRNDRGERYALSEYDLREPQA